MYHRLVRRRIRAAYALINRGEFDALVAQFAPEAVFAFPGVHALGGEFRGPDAVRAWFGEVRRLFPDFHLEPRRIFVSGGPRHTRAATWFAVSGTFPDGTAYRNEGAQLLEMRRGRVVEDRLFEDTVVVVEALDRLRALGLDPGATLAGLRAARTERMPGRTSAP
jgi:ketosteroid isomerase-like protein